MQPILPGASANASRARGKFLILFLNATACYLLAYQAVHFVAEAAPVFMARRANVPGVWGLAGVRFTLGDGGWHRDMVLGVYGLGPLLVLGLGLFASGWFWAYRPRHRRRRRGLLKLWLLWLAFHAGNTVLGGLLADTVTQSGSWYVPNWLLGSGGTWPSPVLGVLFAICEIVLGFLAAIPFLLAQNSRTALQFNNRSQLVRYTIIGPWLVSSLLLALSRLPHLGLNETLHFATMGLLLGPLALGCNQGLFTKHKQKLRPYPTRVAWGMVGLALLALLAWRLALGVPVAFR